jgi:hypothetical protein
MHSVIFHAVLPSEPYEARQIGAHFLAAIAKIEGNKSVKLLGEFVWEVDFQASPDALAVLVNACEQLSRPYGILPLADAPQWIRRDPKKPA